MPCLIILSRSRIALSLKETTNCELLVKAHFWLGNCGGSSHRQPQGQQLGSSAWFRRLRSNSGPFNLCFAWESQRQVSGPSVSVLVFSFPGLWLLLPIIGTHTELVTPCSEQSGVGSLGPRVSWCRVLVMPCPPAWSPRSWGGAHRFYCPFFRVRVV